MSNRIKMIGIGDNVVDVYENKGVMYPGGNALNFAVYASKRGADAAFLGAFGTDYPGVYNRAVLSSLGVDCSHSRVIQGENGRCCINLEKGDRIFLKSNQCGVLRENPLQLSEEDKRYLRQFDWIHTTISSYIDEEILKLHKLGVPISYDFSDCFQENYLDRICPYITLACLSCSSLEEDETIAVMKKIHQKGCILILATRGADGVMLYDGSKIYCQEAFPCHAIDTLGAGDSMASVFVYEYLQGCRGKGFSAGEYSSQEKGDIITRALREGARFAAKTCEAHGAFGMETSYMI